MSMSEIGIIMHEQVSELLRAYVYIPGTSEHHEWYRRASEAWFRGLEAGEAEIREAAGLDQRADRNQRHLSINWARVEIVSDLMIRDGIVGNGQHRLLHDACTAGILAARDIYGVPSSLPRPGGGRLTELRRT